MPDVGVRELKTRASEIVRNVWKRRARYTITYRGRPVGILVPLENPPAAEGVPAPGSEGDAWARLAILGRQVARRWPEGKASGDILSEMRK